MEITFHGTFLHAIDHKDRVSLPLAFRRMFPKGAGKSFIIMRGLDQCLFVFPKSEWGSVQSKLKELPFWKARTRRFLRAFLEHSYAVEADGNHRIKIPQGLMEFARLNREVLFVGMLDKIEIWDPKTYKKYRNREKISLERAAEELLP